MTADNQMSLALLGALAASVLLAVMWTADPAVAQSSTMGDREPEITQCAQAGGIWVGAASTEHPPYVPAGRCVAISVSPELPDDREAVCAAYGGFWVPDNGSGISACAYRKPPPSN